MSKFHDRVVLLKTCRYSQWSACKSSLSLSTCWTSAWRKNQRGANAMNILFIRTAYSAVPLLRSWGQHSDPAVETLKNPTLDGRLTMYHKVVVSDCGRSHSHAIQSNSSLLSPSRTASLWLLAPTLCTSCLTHKRKTTWHSQRCRD